MTTMNELIANQDHLSSICDTIETFQTELDTDINTLTTGLDAEWSRIMSTEEIDAAQMSNTDKERENTYNLVSQLELQLLKMKHKVSSLTQQYVPSSEVLPSLPSDIQDSSNTIPQIITIISHYQDSMDYLENTAKKLQKEVNQMKQSLY